MKANIMKGRGRFPRWLGAAVMVATLVAAVSVAYAADTYPSKPIRLLVPYGPGGIGDLTGRTVAQKMSENMGQKVIVENRPSAGMIVAAEMAMVAPADGYTIFHAGNGVAISTSIFKSLPYNILTDFMQLSTLATYDLVLCVNPNSKFASLAQLLTFAKSNPGKLNLGSIGIGTTQHLSAELFKKNAGIDALTVPYKSTPDLLVALRSGAVDLVFEFVPAVLPQIQGKTIRLLATAAPTRFSGLPDTPTTTEAGLPAFQVSGWNAYSVRASTPRPIVDRLNKEIVAALKAPDLVQKMRHLGAEPWPSTPEQTREFMISEITKWKAVIESANIPRK